MFRKTIKLLTLLAAMVFVSNLSFAQNQWDEEDILTINNEYLIPAQYCPGISYSTNNGILKIYNSNFECIKKINLLPDYISEGDIEVFCLTKGIFTSNNKYEFVVNRWGYDSNDDYFGDSGIYNEDGELLYSFNSEIRGRYSVSMKYNPYITDNKLVVQCYDFCKIFTLHKSINNTSAISSVQQNTNTSKLYPNPAKNSVTLEYDIKGQMQELQIVDMQGRVVASYLLDPSQKQVKINTSNYKKGVYIYRYGNNSGKFVVE